MLWPGGLLTTPKSIVLPPGSIWGLYILKLAGLPIPTSASPWRLVEYYTALRSKRAAERADVALVVCDAQEGVTAQDLRIADLAMKAGCATLLVLNKWDLADDFDLDHERAHVARKLRLRPRVLTASAKTKRNVHRLLVESQLLADRSSMRIPTPELNRFLSEVVQERRAGPAKQGKRLKMLYIAQIAERPPRFADQVNSRTRVTRDWAYFLENEIRARYRMDGIPLIIDFVERGQRRRDGTTPEGRRKAAAAAAAEG